MLQNSGTVGTMAVHEIDTVLFQLQTHIYEPAVLQFGKFFAAVDIGNCKVRKGPFRFQSRQRNRLQNLLYIFLCRTRFKANARHAGVQRNMYPNRLSSRLCCRRKRLCRVGIAQRCRDVIFRQQCGIRIPHIAQHQNRKRKARLAQLYALSNRCHGKKIRARIAEHRRRLYGAVSVSIRLHDAEYLCLRHNRLYVVTNLCKVVSQII